MSPTTAYALPGGRRGARWTPAVLLTWLLLLSACSPQWMGFPPDQPPPGATPTSDAPRPPAAATGTPRPGGVVGDPAPGGLAPFVVYGDGKLAAHWDDASWGGAKFDLHSGEMPRNGRPTLKVTHTDGWGAWSAADWNNRNQADTSKYSHFHFWINGGAAGGQKVGVTFGEARLPIDKYIQGGRIPAHAWQEVFIPLDDLGAGGRLIGRITFQDTSGGRQPPYYLDGIEFYKDSAPPPTPVIIEARVTVDLGGARRPISPLIYGMSVAPDEVIRAGQIPLNRLGGNPYSRYNWTLGSARNAGSDWEFRNYSREPDDPAYRAPSGLADQFTRRNQAAGAATLLTVPMIGYVANNDDNETRSTGVPAEGGAPVTPGAAAIPGYDPATNQVATSVRSQARKGALFADPPDPQAPAVYQDEWVHHLTGTFGPAAQGGVRFYAMDNEPDLWADDTHVDVHPVRVGYDELLARFLDYAGAVKAVDPSAEVTGPVLSGWTGYWFSALDRGSDSFRTAADRRAHGNQPLLPWFLDQVRQRDQQTGVRTLDVLDIHYYPQAPGLAEDKVDPATAALRLRSTRALWDPTYVDESWIARTEAPQVQLIPRLRGWIDQYYPGTKLGITEWKWYAEETLNGALAIADVLGIYGREGVYLATYFTNPPLGSPGLEAFKLYRNYDGHGATFGDVALDAQVSLPADTLAVFASEDTATRQVKLMVLNKSPREAAAAQIALRGGVVGAAARVYQLSEATGRKIQPRPATALTAGTLRYTFPPYSATLLVLDQVR